MRLDSQNRRLASILAIAVSSSGVLALWLRFNAAPGSRGMLYPHDLLYSYYPKLAEVGARLAAGEVPLWHPHGCAGVPLLATLQPAVLYPPTWLAAFFEPGSVLAGLVLFHVFLGAAGMALLFRSWGLSAWVAGGLAGPMAFACLLGQSFWPPQVATFAWLPWILLCIERLLGGEPGWRWWLGLVSASALQWLAGFPQIVLYGLQLSVPYAVVRALTPAWRGAARPAVAARALAGVAAAMVLGAGIAAAQLLPAAEWIAESGRVETAGADEVHYLQQESRLGTLVSNAVTPAVRNPAVEIGRGAGYLGIGVLVLAAMALGARAREPLVWLMAAVGIASFLLSDGYLGMTRPLYEAYAALPVLGQLRSPERLLLPAFFCVIALAALGAGACERVLTGERAGFRWGLAVAVPVAGWAAATGGWPAGWRAALALVLLALCGWGASWKLTRALWSPLVGVLLLADVVAVAGPFASLRDLPRAWAAIPHVSGQAVLTASEFARERDRAGFGRIEIAAKGLQVRPFSGVGPMAGTYRLACYETPLPRGWGSLSRRFRSGDFVATAQIDPDRFATLYDAAGVVSVAEVTVHPRLAGALAMAAGRVYRQHAQPRLERPEGLEVRLSHNTDALPRAYLLSRYEQASQEENLHRLALGEFDPHALVLLESDPGVPSSGAIPQPVAARIERYEPERVELYIDAPAAGILVLSDTDYPGWRAWVDDTPSEIWRANGLFRAVPVPSGSHRVVFEYAPASLRWGLWITVTCVAVALVVPLVATGRARRRA